MKSILYVRLPCHKIHPSGVVYLADYVHKHAPKTKQKILDLAIVPRELEEKTLLANIDEFNPDAIAFSWRDIQPFSPDQNDSSLENAFKFYFSPNIFDKAKAALTGAKMVLSYDNRLKKNLALVKTASRNFPQKKILIGGPAFSVFGPLLIEKCPPGTIGVIGEGENVFLKLIQGKDILTERVLIKEKNGQIVQGKQESYVEIEKSTPVDFDYIASIFPEFSEYTDGVIGVQTKRGCPHRCLFCLYNYVDGTKVRYRPPEVIGQEVEQLNRNFGVNKIWFCDSQFYPSPSALPIVEKTLDEILKRKLDIQWGSYLRADSVTPTMAKKMLQSGMGDFELSLTSGSQKVINSLRLGFKLDKFMEACQIIKDAGYKDQKIKLILSLNAPGETKETLLETIETVKKVSAIFGTQNVQPFIFFLAVQPHTGLAEVAIEKGYLSPNFNPLALNPFIIKNLIYNPPPLGKMIGQTVVNTLGHGDNIGRRVLAELEEKLK